MTSAPAAAVTTVTEVTSAMPGPKGLVAGPSGAAGSGTTPEDKRPDCLKQFMETIHLVIMKESLGKAASAGTEATAAVAAVTSVTAVTSAPVAAVTLVTAVTSAVPGPKGPVTRPSGVVGSRTTPEDNRPVCLKQFMETIHLVIMNESLGKAASAGTEATAAVAAVTLVTAVTSAPAAAVTTVTAVTSAVPGPKGPVMRPNGVVGSGTTPEDNGPVKILLNLRRQFTAYKGNALNYYCMAVKRIKFKLIRTKAWTLGSWLIERSNSLQACRTSRSCGRFRQVIYSVFRKIASWIWEAIIVKVSRCSGCPTLRWRGRWTQRRGRWTHWQGQWTHRRSQDSVDHLTWLGNLTRLSCMRSFKTRTIWFWIWFRTFWLRLESFKMRTLWFWIWFRTFWLRLNRGEVVVDNNVVGGEVINDERSGSPETICWITNSFKTRTLWFWIWFRTFWLRLNRGEVVVDNNVVGGEVINDERSGSPETICWITNSFKTRTFWFWIWFRTLWLRLNRGEVVVADNVNAVIVVDDDQSGLPETIRLCENGPLASYISGSNYCIQRKYNIE